MDKKTFLQHLSEMPALRHSQADGSFDIDKSEVVIWLLALPDIKQVIFDLARNSGRIKFNPDTKKWSGVPKGPRGRPKKVVAETEDEMEVEL